MAAKELSSVTHEKQEGTFTEPVGTQAEIPRHSCQRLFAGELDGLAGLACSDEAAKKDFQVAQERLFAGVTGTASSFR